IAALRRFGRGDELQRRRERAIGVGALAAAVEMLLDVGAARALLVVIEDQIFFAVVLHDSPLSGSSATRSLRTARNTLCLVALVPRPSALPISAIDRPS